MWIDEVDVPVAERIEQYRITVTGSTGAAEFLADQPSLSVSALSVSGFGAGSATIEVCQVGDLAVSRAAQVSITIP
jgi:hypothetical protein